MESRETLEEILRLEKYDVLLSFNYFAHALCCLLYTFLSLADLFIRNLFRNFDLACRRFLFINRENAEKSEEKFEFGVFNLNDFYFKL